jgi:predicted enzyme related to lactoylglutathione lyase
MERVHGIGGVFFRARDPEVLARWYQDHLGVALTPRDYEQRPWWPEGGPTAFQPFAADTEYFGNAEQAWMVNFRVRNLGAMVKQLEAAAITVTVDPIEYPNGKFARLQDPEGNPVELWEPRGSHGLPG